MDKQAEDAMLQAAMQDPSNRIRADVAGKILALGLGAAGAGVAARGIGGLSGLFQATQGPAPKVPARRRVIRMDSLGVDPTKQASGPLEAAAEAAATVKAAEEPLTGLSGMGAKALNAVGGIQQKGQEWGPIARTFWNPDATIPTSMPWTWLAAPAAAVGGLYAGHKLTDMALKPGEQAERDSELTAAKQRYEQAISGGSKMAAALDEGADALLEKSGVASWTDLLARFAGPALLTGGAAAAGGAALGYRLGSADDDRQAMESALNERRKQLASESPPPLVVLPPAHNAKRPNVEALRERFAPKAASLSGAAEATLARFDRRRQTIQQQTAVMTGQAKPPAPGKPAAPMPPKLPSVVSR